MMTFNVKSVRLSLTFGFFFVVAMTALRDNSLGALSLLFCLAHEFGHILAMRLYGVKPRSIKFYGAGISISAEGISSLENFSQAVIYLSGPIVNLLLALILRGDASALNLCLAVFNLLPIKYFDGGKLAELTLGNRKKVLIVLSVASHILIAAFAISAIILNPQSFSASSFMTVCFIAMSYFLDG